MIIMTLLMIPHYSPIPNAFWELSTYLCYIKGCAHLPNGSAPVANACQKTKGATG